MSGFLRSAAPGRRVAVCMARLTLARVNPGDDARESGRVAGVSLLVCAFLPAGVLAVCVDGAGGGVLVGVFSRGAQFLLMWWGSVAGLA